MQTQMVNFTIPKKILAQADKLAAKEFRSRSELFREAIRRYINEQKNKKEDFERIKKAALMINMNEEQAMILVEKVRNELPMNK